MRLADCMPLPGQGLVARTGNLVVLCAIAGGGEDLLLTAMDEVAAAGGDGSDLVRRVTRAALEQDQPPAWACAGITATGAVAVLVYGEASARVTAGGGESVGISGADSVIPVSRTFTGPPVTVMLKLPGHGDADDRLRLDGGVVQGGGVRLTATAGAAGEVVPPVQQQVQEVQQPVQPVRQPIEQFQPPAEQQVQQPPPLEAMPPPPDHETAPMPEPEQPAAPPPPAALPPRMHEPDPASQYSSYLLILPEDSDVVSLEPEQAAQLGQPGQPGLPPPIPMPEPMPAPEPADPRQLVDGVYCPQPVNKHFNDPEVQYCRVCGLAMLQQTRNVQKGPRPPLGVLVLDDGTTLQLDTDYVLGRDPVMDADVAAGRARPLRIIDPAGTISRLHLRIALVGWRVHVVDLGSANGSVVHHPGIPQPQRLTPHQAVEIQPGTTIDVGRRTLRFDSYLAH
jgi:FHA domain